MHNYIVLAQFDVKTAHGTNTPKTSPGGSRGSGDCMERRTLVLDVQLGASVARTAFRIVRTVVVGVRRDRAALAVTHRAHQATGVDAVAGQVVVHGAGA